MARQLPISGIIPTRNRPDALQRTLESLAAQDAHPLEIVFVDGSDDDASQLVVQRMGDQLNTRLVYHRAERLGAAIQRNQAFRHATQNFIWFLDDDILFEPYCMTRLWDALQADPALGGVNALITNCYYEPPGRASRFMFAWMNGGKAETYAGRCLGPAVNLAPSDAPNLPEVVPQDWLNSGCTIYRRDGLPDPPFETFFTGYSLMEDLTVSLRVAKKYRLANVRTVRIFHDSQPGSHKSNARELAKMELLNRHFVMTRILERKSLNDYVKLLGWETFQMLALAMQREQFWRIPARMLGKLQALATIAWPFAKSNA